MRRWNWWRGLLLAVLVGAVCAVGVPTGQALAATNQGPDPTNFVESTRYGNSYPGVARQVDYVVATSAFNTILQTTIKIYMPASSGQIVVHNQNICYATFKAGGRNYDQLDDGVINSSGNAVSFRIGATTLWGAFDSSGTCDSKTVTFNVSGGVLDPNTGLYPFQLVVSANPATDKYMDTFWVTAPAGAYVSQDSSLSTSSFGMNQTSPIPAGNNPGNTQSPPNPYVNYSHWFIPFGPDCSVTTPTVNKRIELFDDDNRGNWDVQPRPFFVRVNEYDRSGVLQNFLTANSITFPDGAATGNYTYYGNGMYEVWTTSSGKRIWMDYTFKRDMKYQWYVDSAYYDNTLQFKIPFDNVFYYLECATNGFNLQPNIGVAVTSGGAPVSGNTAEAGDSVTFSYAVNNIGSTDSSSVACTIYANSHAGYFAVPSPAESTGSSPPVATGCPRAFPEGVNTPLGSETVNGLPANTSVCRSLYVNPSTPGGPPLGTEVCVYVTSKPYTRVYGGDVSAGGLMASPNSPASCSQNTGAAIIGWNRRSASAPAYAGAGVQFAAYAMSTIFDVATALGSSGSATSPTGLSFANDTTNATDTANGIFGGSFGPVACIADYYNTRPASTASLPPSPAITNMVTGTPYGTNGDAYFSGGGTISQGERITVYVDGNAYIDTNITYAGSGSWTNSTIPSFRLIARGNILIGANVSQLDGLYVAQPTSGGSGGVIYTCASTAGGQHAILRTDPTFFSQCDNQKLTVNGSFVAKQLYLSRTIGTLRQSSAGEASTSANIAETFNYGPFLWMMQPTDSTGGLEYDAINSLPPVL